MITRRRYNVPVKKANLESGRQMDLQAGRRSARRGKPSRAPSGEASPPPEARMAVHAPVRDAEEYWWTDWRSMAAVVGLVFAIGAGLYLVSGLDLGSGGSSTAASSPVRPASTSSSNAAGAYASAEGTGARRGPPVSDAQSFLAFSRTAKAAHAARGAPAGSADSAPRGSATAAPQAAGGTGQSPPSGSPSVISHGDQKVVLPDKLSGDCAVGGASLAEFLKGLGSCFSRRAGGDA